MSQNESTTRRDFIVRLLGLSVFAIPSGKASLFLFKKARHELAPAFAKRNPVTVSYVFGSKVSPGRVFASASEFWAFHEDPRLDGLNERLNASFKWRGWIEATKSELLPDGKSVLYTKVYRSPEALQLFKEKQKALSARRPQIDVLTCKSQEIRTASGTLA